MLKIIKYDLKSMGIVTAVFSIMAIILSIVFCIILSTANLVKIGENFYTACTLNMLCYVAFVIAAAGNMWKRVNSNTELYEMAGVSPLKVGAARMLIVFVAVTLFAYLLTLGESILYKIFYSRMMEDYYFSIRTPSFRDLTIISNYSNCMFALNGLKLTNIFTPIFAGMYISILFTTSFLFATLTRRFNNKLASSLVLGALVCLVIMLNFSVLNKINIYLPELNLNKLGVGGLIIERFGSGFAGNEYTSFAYMMNPNLLNVGLLLYQALYVILMFSIYSIRRKAI